MTTADRREIRFHPRLLACMALVVVVVGVTTLMRRVHVPGTGQPAANSTTDGIEVVSTAPETMRLSPRVVRALGMQTEQVQPATDHRRLTLSGSLFLDSNRMVRVHSRFSGEVVSIGDCRDAIRHPSDDHAAEACQSVRVGDRVTKGQLLAVIWSKEIGEKKSDLVNSLSQLYLDRAQLERLKKLKEVVPERTVHEAERQYEADVISVERLERTLRSWRLTEDEITVVRQEAERIHQGHVDHDNDVDKTWAEIDVQSPLDGIVLEKNIVVGDIVNADLDLYKIADVSVLGVFANLYEDDLAAIEALKPDARHWTIHLKAMPDAPPLPGTFEVISNIIDPNQHTAAVLGWLRNAEGRLRAGQFITADIGLPLQAGEVEIPETATIDEGATNAVFVASDASGREVTRRRVALIGRGQNSRGRDLVYIRAEPTAAERARGCQPLKPGEWIVVGGIIELDGAWSGAMATLPSKSGQL